MRVLRGGLVAALLVGLPVGEAAARPIHVPPPGNDRLEHQRPTRPPASAGAADGHEAPSLDHGHHALMQRARAMGSGTGQLPATSPMRMWALPAGPWLWMLHGNLVSGQNRQAGPRGAEAWAAENWQMLMGSGVVGPGLLDLRLMTSLEPWSLPPGGTPQLFQTGETWQGRPLVDRQHPHDALAELSARYTWTPAEQASLFLYGGLVGEPALGPVAFMHRPSAADNAWAPLGHHLQDAAHISQGVVTAGLGSGAWRLEGSAFNGREPDEDRVGVVLRPLDAWATRLSWTPDPRWVLQVSTARLRDPEPLVPGDVERTTASAMVAQPVPGGLWSTMALWSHQTEAHDGARQPLLGLGLESQYDFGATHLYGRAEWLDKAGLPGAESHGVRRVGAFTLGLARDLDWSDALDLALGVDATTHVVPADLMPLYGDAPVSWRVYARLRPPTMAHDPRSSP